MNDCKTLRENLFAYRENEISPSMKVELDRHVASCSTCASLVQQFDNVLDSVKAHTDVEPRPFAETRLLQRIENYLENSRKPLFGFPVRTSVQPVAISVVLMLAMAIGILIGTGKAGKQINLTTATDREIRRDLNIPETTDTDFLQFNE
ncbi:MAG TPA: zf-HC2 domain-containing protein [Bacteroidales bacterium]|nr:zf-HC2 domain-containing protein [Bacteroidales bacterium]